MALLGLKKLFKGMKDDALVKTDLERRLSSMRLLEFENLTVGELKKVLRGMNDDACVFMELQNWGGRCESRNRGSSVMAEWTKLQLLQAVLGVGGAQVPRRSKLCQ